jgi:hypothetical protein
LWSCRNNRGFELEAGGFADNRGFELTPTTKHGWICHLRRHLPELSDCFSDMGAEREGKSDTGLLLCKTNVGEGIDVGPILSVNDMWDHLKQC